MGEPSGAGKSMSEQRKAPTFADWMGSMWLYTILRIGLFLALWGLLVLIGLHGIFALLVAAALSIPLSLVLLAIPRRRLAVKIEQRVDARREQRSTLDSQLDSEPPED